LIAIGKNASKAAGLGLSLKTWSPHVTVLTNGDALDDDYRAQLGKARIEYCQHPIERIVHENGRVRYVKLQSGEHVEGQAVFFNSGERQQSNLAAMLGITYDSEATVRTLGKQRSDVPGVSWPATSTATCRW
jgi:hypothetical protein